MPSDNSITKVTRMVFSDDVAGQATSRRDETALMVTEVCEDCNGTGTKLDPERGAIRCPCTIQDSLQKRTVAAHIPLRYARCSINNFKREPNTPQDAAFQYAWELMLNYPAVDRGLLLMGPPGVGKTHLAVAILKGLIEKGIPCLFCEFGALLKQIQDSYNPISKTSEMRVLAPVYDAEVLVLDELGSTLPTDWVRDTMYQIINRRYNDKKLTIFTTNFMDQPANDQSQSTDGVTEYESGARTFSRKVNSERIRALTTLEDRIGTRLRSRLYEMCRKVEIKCEDYRRNLDNRR